MFENISKFVIIILITVSTDISSKNIQSAISSEYDSTNSKEDKDLESERWKNKWKEQSRWMYRDMDSNAANSELLSSRSGSEKEQKNVEHAQLKRSDTQSNVPLVEGCGAVNMSDPVSKFHCPVNLLFGNNLTVKNYFLMASPCNASIKDTINQIKQSEDKEVMEFIGTSGINVTSESTTEMVELTKGTVATEQVSKAEEINLKAEVWTMTMITEPVEKSSTTIEDTVTTESTTLSVPPETETTTCPTTPLAASTTLDPYNEIMRTVSKYCETFNLTADNGTYTINPVSVAQSQIELLQDGISKNNNAVKLKKSKRNSRVHRSNINHFKLKPANNSQPS